MCEASVYMIDGEDSELIMEAVDRVEPAAGGIKLENIFGAQKFLSARIHSVSLESHKVFLKPV